MADNPISYHRLEEAGLGHGSTVGDSSGNGSTGVLYDTGYGITSVTGPITTEADNKALRYGRVGAGGTASNSFTVELWVRAPAFAVAPGIASDFWFSFDGGFAQYFVRARAYGSTGMVVVQGTNGGFNDFTHSGPTTLADGQWHHWVLTKNHVTDQARAYIDGVEYFSSNASTFDLAFLNMVQVYGDAGDVPGSFGTWEYDEWAVYNTALSAARVQAHYQAASTSPPSNSAAPSVSGTAKSGQTLSTTNGTWSGSPTPTYTYQWQRNTGSGWTDISGATSSTYTLTDGDVGATVRSRVTATNSAGNDTASSSATGTVAALEPSNSTAPSVSGPAKSGQTLSTTNGTWAGTGPFTYAYQWQRNTGSGWTDISGATSSTYTLTDSDASGQVRVLVIATGPGGSATQSSASVDVEPVAIDQPTAPVNIVKPVISGSIQSGSRISADPGTWTGDVITYAYQWQRCNRQGEQCQDIDGAREPAYFVAPGDRGHTLRAQVTATNASGASQASSDPSAVVGSPAPQAPALPWTGTTPSGQPSVPAGKKISVGEEDLPALDDLSLQWVRCNAKKCTSIPGADKPNYRPGDPDVGYALKLVIIGTRDGKRFELHTQRVMVRAPDGWKVRQLRVTPRVMVLPLQGAVAKRSQVFWRQRATGRVVMSVKRAGRTLSAHVVLGRRGANQVPLPRALRRKMLSHGHFTFAIRPSERGEEISTVILSRPPKQR